MTIGERIRRARIARGISADKLAELVGKNRSTIFRYENGDLGGARVGALEPIAAALGTTPAALMGWTHEWDDPSDMPTETQPRARRIPHMYLHCPPNPASEPFMVESANGHAPLGDYVVTAIGDRMTGPTIHEGDVVFIREQFCVEDGNVALLIIDRTLAIMRVYHTQTGTTLSSDNPKIPPIRLESAPGARILGRVICLHRML